jgi:acetyl-CoA carboxylase biotin carboxyl carrier protein
MDEADLEALTETDEASELITLIDRLEGVLERSGLAELEVGSGATTIVLRSAASVSHVAVVGVAPSTPGPDGGPAPGASAPVAPESSGLHSISAPLTGIYYTAPSPDAAPYVRIGAQVVVGQVIGLIEAMKLYNEIKCDVAGRVVRLAAENGKLVKARQALIEVEPS